MTLQYNQHSIERSSSQEKTVRFICLQYIGFWMENLGFLERKKQALEAYRSTYDQKYDIPYQKEFYSVMNFTNIWQNSCNLLTS